MYRRMLVRSVVLPAVIALLVVAPKLWAASFSQTRIIIEVNATAGDGGIQIFLDATGWNRLEVFDPNRQSIFQVDAAGSVGITGVTELFCESAEPSFQDLPLSQMLARFAAGSYTFEGTTTDGKPLNGRATLSHSIPAAPQVVSPAEGATLNSAFPVTISWNAVAAPFPGTSAPVTIAGFQVIVERVRPQPLLVFSVHLPATATQVTVPAEFVQAGAEYNVEVLTIEAGGNQTISESRFSTTR